MKDLETYLRIIATITFITAPSVFSWDMHILHVTLIVCTIYQDNQNLQILTILSIYNFVGKFWSPEVQTISHIQVYGTFTNAIKKSIFFATQSMMPVAKIEMGKIKL